LLNFYNPQNTIFIALAPWQLLALHKNVKYYDAHGHVHSKRIVRDPLDFFSCLPRRKGKIQACMIISFEMSAKMLLMGIIGLSGFFNGALIPSPVSPTSSSTCHLQAS